MIHAIALLLAILLGIGVAQMVAVEPSIFVAVILAALIFVFQVAAYYLAHRVSQPRPAPVVEYAPRVSATWGWLKPASGVGAGFPLTKDRIRIGRGVDMDITLNNASISRQHAELQRLMDGCLVRDAGSRNGVFVNGMRIEEQLLSDGDQVAMGELRFVFVQVAAGPRASTEVSVPVEVAPTAAGAWNPTAETVVRRGGAKDRGEEAEGAPRDSRPFDDTSEYQADAED